MNDKFTVRDFLVYFLTGSYFLIILLFEFRAKMFYFFSVDKASLKDNTTLILALMVPGLYIVGHVIHGLDDTFFKITRYTKKTIENKRNFFIRKLTLPVILLANLMLYHRITTHIEKSGVSTKDFWKNCGKLIINSKYDKADYWSLMHTLFEGLTFITIVWTFYCLFYCSTFVIMFYVSLSIIMWLRSKQMADNFVSQVNNTIEYIT